VHPCGPACCRRTFVCDVEAHLRTVGVIQVREHPSDRGAQDRSVRFAEVVEAAGQLIEGRLVWRAHLEVDPACGLRRVFRVEPACEERAAVGWPSP